MRRIAVLLSAAAIVFCAADSSAATRTWTGAGDSPYMSRAANWAGGVVPAAGDRLYFPSTGHYTAVWNDIPNASFEAVESDSRDYVALSGLPLTLTGSVPITCSPQG